MSSALLLVDIQNDYFPEGALPLVGMPQAAGRAARLLARFRAQGAPRFFIRHVAADPAATFFRPDTPGADIHAAVRPAADETVITKHFPNSFRKTPLADALRRAGVTRVVLCGAMSHMCIDATTRAAADLGFACTVVHDACATRDLAFEGRVVPAAAVHDAFMAALGAAYAQVLTCAAFEAQG